MSSIDIGIGSAGSIVIVLFECGPNLLFGYYLGRDKDSLEKIMLAVSHTVDKLDGLEMLKEDQELIVLVDGGRSNSIAIKRIDDQDDGKSATPIVIYDGIPTHKQIQHAINLFLWVYAGPNGRSPTGFMARTIFGDDGPLNVVVGGATGDTLTSTLTLMLGDLNNILDYEVSIRTVPLYAELGTSEGDIEPADEPEIAVHT